MRKLIVLLIGLVFLASCNQNKVFEQHNKMENNVWNHFKELKFDAKIEKPGNYDVFIAVRHADFYQYDSLTIDFEMVKPNGESQVIPLIIWLKNKKGKFLGKGAGDIWDYNYPVYTNVNFADTGNYHFEMDNVMPVYDLQGIMEIGLEIDKAKK